VYRFEGIRDVARLAMVTALAWVAASSGVVSHFPDVLTGLIVGLIAGLAADIRRRNSSRVFQFAEGDRKGHSSRGRRCRR